MFKILFICHGNICRSPMAEFVFKDMLKKHNLDRRVYAFSKAATYEEEGNPIYPNAQAQLRRRGIPFDRHEAHRTEKADYGAYDLIICMDDENLYDLARIYGGDPDGKVRLLMEYAGKPCTSVADPWYTRNFDLAFDDIYTGCAGLIEQIKATL